MGRRHDMYSICKVLPVSICPTIPRRPVRVSLIQWTLSHLILLYPSTSQPWANDTNFLATQIRLLSRLALRTFHCPRQISSGQSQNYLGSLTQPPIPPPIDVNGMRPATYMFYISLLSVVHLY